MAFLDFNFDVFNNFSFFKPKKKYLKVLNEGTRKGDFA
jgi:hypothetical protein